MFVTAKEDVTLIIGTERVAREIADLLITCGVNFDFKIREDGGEAYVTFDKDMFCWIFDDINDIEAIE